MQTHQTLSEQNPRFRFVGIVINLFDKACSGTLVLLIGCTIFVPVHGGIGVGGRGGLKKRRERGES